MRFGIRTRLARNWRRLTRKDAKLADAYFGEHAVYKLHVGCGENVMPGWLNCDLNPRSAKVMMLDAMAPFPFESGQFEYLFTEHLIEHFDYRQGRKLLSECFRVLKPGGKIRVATPDLMFLADLCKNPEKDVHQRYIDWATGLFIPEAPRSSAAFVVNNFFYCDWGHRFIYDPETLSGLMGACGFAQVEECEIGVSTDPALADLEYQRRMPAGFLKLESMILEATKPDAAR